MKQRIEKGCSNADNQKMNIGYYNRARDALGSILDEIGIKSRDKIFLPAYIGWSAREGSGVFDPISERQICPVFYKLDGRLNIDADDLTAKIRTIGAKAILLIHYFGFADPQCKTIIKLANERRIPVIEDAAHAMFTDFIGEACGRDGDYTIYSLHKMLPMKSGGMLLANRDKVLPKKARSVCKYGNPFQYDFKEISKKRVENYNLITSYIGTGNELIKPLYEELPSGVIPQTYPILLPLSNRNDMYQKMNDMGWGVVSLYHTLINTIEPKEFSETYELSKHILNLPVHQDTDPTLIGSMIEDLFDVAIKCRKKSSIYKISKSALHIAL